MNQERRAEWERIGNELAIPFSDYHLYGGPERDWDTAVKAIADALEAQFNAGVEAAAQECDACFNINLAVKAIRALKEPK